MPYPVLCRDGVDRLKCHHPTREAALEDARYFLGRTFGCGDWSRDFSCPAGPHWVPDGDPELEPETAWALDV